MLFHEWLRTTYSKSSRCRQLLLTDPHFVGDEEKAKRTSHNRVSIVSTNTPNHTDMDTTADPPTTSPDAMNPPLPSPLNVVPQTLSLPPLALPPQTLSLPPPAPPPQTLSLPPPVPPPTREDVTDQLINENDPGCASETRQTSPSFHDDLDPNPPSALSPPIRSPAEGPIPPRSSAPTPGAVLPQPLLTCAGSGVFNLTGVFGDFISEGTRVYWESVPGGEKWVALVKNYLELEAIPPLKGVSSRLCHILFEQTNTIPSNTSALRRHLDHRICKPG